MKWKLVPAETTPEIRDVIRNEVCVYQSEDDLYHALLEAAPQPPKLSDERIWDMYEAVMSTDTQTPLIELVRAIERELLGE